MTGGLGLATAATLAACGVGGGGSSASSNALTLLVEAGGHGELQPIADKFQAETGTTVSFVELPYDGLYNRLSSELNGNAVSFDIAALDAIWLSAFRGALLPLDDLFTKEVKSDLFPSLVKEAAPDGTFIGMPAWTNAEIVYYRTDLLEDPAHKSSFVKAYGYDLAPPTTWEQYRDVAKYFSEAMDGKVYGTDVKGAVETEWLATLAQTGEKNLVVDPDGTVSLGNKNSLAALNFYTSLLPYAPSGAAQLDWAGAQNLFNQGQLALMRFWAHGYRQIPEDSPVAGNVGVAPMIGGAAGPAAIPGAWYLSIAKGSRKQDLARKFVQYAYDHNELSIETSLGLAARVSALEAQADKAGFEYVAPLLETLNAPATLPRPAVPQWQEIVDTALTPMIQKAMESGADNATLLSDARKEVENIVA
ncbi:extracellular solute-binding protein [Actinomyces slackii]|uniref:extracellular solute-binding protein n=1 Tax=Actinomyces slackii TaxID=52774 RepID=UPI00047B1496